MPCETELFYSVDLWIYLCDLETQNDDAHLCLYSFTTVTCLNLK